MEYNEWTSSIVDDADFSSFFAIPIAFLTQIICKLHSEAKKLLIQVKGHRCIVISPQLCSYMIECLLKIIICSTTDPKIPVWKICNILPLFLLLYSLRYSSRQEEGNVGSKESALKSVELFTVMFERSFQHPQRNH